MKNGHSRHIFISVSLCILVIALFSTCRSRKNVVRTESHQARTERVETKTDTSRVITKTVADMEESISVHETTDRETIHLDSTGRVRRIVKESISKETGQRRTDRGQGSVVSVNGLETITVSNSDSEIERSVADKSITDTRPVQGFEWFWIMLVIVSLLLTVGFIMYKRLKR